MSLTKRRASERYTTLEGNAMARLGDVYPIVDTLNSAVLISLNDGGIDASTNPNYPAMTANHYLVVTVAGKIGGGAGPNVDIGDMILAKVTTAGGTHAAVGANFVIVEHNIDINSIVGTFPVPEVRTNSPITASDINTNIGELDAAIGDDADFASLNYIAVADTISANLSALDASVGAVTVPEVRTNNPITVADASTSIGELDAAIGNDADIASTNYIAIADTVNANISALDAELGSRMVSEVITVSVGAPAIAGCDFNFASAANMVEQPIQIATLPANARVIDMYTVTTASFADAGGAIVLNNEIGVASSSNEYIASADIGTLAAVTEVAVAGYPFAGIAQDEVWVAATPAVNWDTLIAGKVNVVIAYNIVA